MKVLTQDEIDLLNTVWCEFALPQRYDDALADLERAGYVERVVQLTRRGADTIGAKTLKRSHEPE